MDYGIKTTRYFQKYWRERKLNWKKDYQSPEMINHPHRDLIIRALRSFYWVSLFEIGVGAGSNLLKILQNFKGRQIGGVDINKEAIELCQQTFGGGMFKVNSADDVFLSDKSTDVILSDMLYIYVSPFKINKHIKEIKRLARNYFVGVEFHNDKWYNRLALWWKTGYFAHDWKKLLKKNDFYDIFMYKLKEEDWPGGNPQKDFAYLIIAKLK